MLFRSRDEFTIHCETQIFAEFWLQHGVNDALRLQTLRESAGGRNLVELGYDRDIERASQVDLFHVVPTFDRATGELRVS